MTLKELLAGLDILSSSADLKKVRIQKLAKEKQRKIAGNYRKLAQAIKETQETLMVLQQSMHHLLNS